MCQGAIKPGDFDGKLIIAAASADFLFARISFLFFFFSF